MEQHHHTDITSGTRLSRAGATLALAALLALNGCAHLASTPPRGPASRASSGFELPLLALEASGRNVCALGYAERVQCTRVDRAPGIVYDVPGTEDAVELALSTGRGCVTTGAGEVLCFPLNGEVAGQARPVHGVEDAAEVALTDDLACARRYDGRVLCWAARGAPTLVEGVTSARTIAAVDRTACALRDDGRVACWGPELSASEVPGLEDAVALGAGPDGTLAVAEDGGIYFFHHFGGGAYVPAHEIARVPAHAIEIAVGERRGCVQGQDGSTRCWEGESWALWRERSLDGAVSIAVGDGFACGLRSDGELRCRPAGGATRQIASRSDH